MDTPSIPQLNQSRPHSTLSAGLNSLNLASQAAPNHPLDTISSSVHSQIYGAGGIVDLDQVKRIYGSALAMQLKTEIEHVASVGSSRMPGLDSQPQRNVLLDSLTGGDLRIGFEDVLNRKETRVEGPRVVLHEAMEVKFGLN
jgi:hypothetical protein